MNGRVSRPPERPSRPERSSRSEDPAATRARLVEVLRVASVALALYVATEATRGYLSQNAAAAAVLPGLLTEWVAGRMGVAWNDPHGPAVPFSESLRRGGRGALIAMGLSTCVVGMLLVTHSGTVSKGEFGLGEWLTGMVVTVFVTLRFELLAHGFVLRMLANSPSFALKIVSVSLLSGAFSLAAGGSATTVMVRGLAGALSGTLWVVDSSGLRALGFHATWAFLWSTALHGSPVDLRATEGLFAGKEGPGTGPFAGVCLLSAMIAITVIIGKKSASDSRPNSKPDSKADSRKDP